LCLESGPILFRCQQDQSDAQAPRPSGGVSSYAIMPVHMDVAGKCRLTVGRCAAARSAYSGSRSPIGRLATSRTGSESVHMASAKRQLLSGGATAKVALARALALVEPPVLLIDEHFRITTPRLREDCGVELVRLQRSSASRGHVTHDQSEALATFLSYPSRSCRDGAIEQVGCRGLGRLSAGRNSWRVPALQTCYR